MQFNEERNNEKKLKQKLMFQALWEVASNNEKKLKLKLITIYIKWLLSNNEKKLKQGLGVMVECGARKVTTKRN